MPLTIWSIRWSKVILRPIVRFLNLIKNPWEILHDPDESLIRTGASAKGSIAGEDTGLPAVKLEFLDSYPQPEAQV